jgi:hypothetical protein
MLISRRHDGLSLVSQPEHARLAGRLAEHWGNQAFAVDRPTSASLTVAAARHDDGWHALDAVPVVLDEEGRPAHFLEVPLGDTIAPYREGVDLIYQDDPYAGVLASMHWAGLYSSRWGMQGSPPLDHPLALEVVEAEEQRVARHSPTLWREQGGLRSSFQATLWRNYEILQALDFISLALCLIDTRETTAADAGHVEVAATLRGLLQPPGGREIAFVPVSGAEHTTLRLRVVAERVVELDPFPLADPEVQVKLTARAMADEAYPDAAAAYQAAEPVELAITLVGPAA